MTVAAALRAADAAEERCRVITDVYADRAATAYADDADRARAAEARRIVDRAAQAAHLIPIEAVERARRTVAVQTPDLLASAMATAIFFAGQSFGDAREGALRRLESDCADLAANLASDHRLAVWTEAILHMQQLAAAG